MELATLKRLSEVGGRDGIVLLTALETTLIPSSSNAQLKGLLETGLKIFKGHQQHAEHTASMVK